MDYDLSPKWRLTGRYTHDLSETRELGGLFLGIAIPNVATTDTNGPGPGLRASAEDDPQQQRAERVHVPAVEQRASRRRTRTAPRASGRDYGISIPEIFAENADQPHPDASPITGLSSIALEPAVQHRLRQPHVHRQLLVAARQPRVQGRRAW